MLSSSEIKARFEAKTQPIDIYGNFVAVTGDFYKFPIQFARLLHYHLINGMPEEQAMEKLIELGYPTAAAEYAMNCSKAFIKDVLKIDLEALQREMVSTAAYVDTALQTLTKAITERFKRTVSDIIEYDGHLFEADATTLQSIAMYLASGQCPDYWTTATNEIVSGWTLAKLKGLNAALADRTALAHALMTNDKAKARVLAEARDLDGLNLMLAECK